MFHHPEEREKARWEKIRGEKGKEGKREEVKYVKRDTFHSHMMCCCYYCLVGVAHYYLAPPLPVP